MNRIADRSEIMKNMVKEKILQNQKVVGTFFELGSLSEMECLGNANLDYVVIDTEHGPFDTETVMNLIRTAELVNLTPFVRVAETSHKEIQRCLDVGAMGVIVPLVKTIEDIKKIVEFAKFPPLGGRGFCPVRASKFGYADCALNGIDHYMKVCNSELMVLPQCETKECLDIIEEIVRMKGVDGIFVGPFDLSISLGIPAQFTSETFVIALKRIFDACKNVGKPIFIYAGNVEGAKKYLHDGFDSVAYSMDAEVLINAYKSIIHAIKE